MTWSRIPEYEMLDELWLDIGQELVNLKSRGSRDGDCREVVGYSARLLNPTAHFLFNPIRRMHPSYAGAELLWYLRGDNDIRMMKAYAPQYERFCKGRGDEPNTAWGAYGHRWKNDFANTNEFFSLVHGGQIPEVKQNWFLEDNSMKNPLSQIQQVALLLKKKPDSRQAVITCWNAGDLPHAIAGDKGDIPCTLSLQFRIENSRLNLIVTMRSNDAWLGLPYDTFCFTSIQFIVAEALQLELGWYQLNAGSMHLYDRNRERMQEALRVTYDTGVLNYTPHQLPVKHLLPRAIKLEEMRRRENITSGGMELEHNAGEGSLLNQISWMIGFKWGNPQFVGQKIKNRVMRDYMEAFNADR